PAARPRQPDAHVGARRARGGARRRARRRRREPLALQRALRGRPRRRVAPAPGAVARRQGGAVRQPVRVQPAEPGAVAPERSSRVVLARDRPRGGLPQPLPALVPQPPAADGVLGLGGGLLARLRGALAPARRAGPAAGALG